MPSERAQLTGRERRLLERNVPLFYAFRFLREAQIWIPVWIVFLIVDRGFSLTQVGVAEACFLLGLVVLEVPTGAVADRYGRSTSLALGAGALIASMLVFAFSTSFPILLVSFLMWSVAVTLMSGADLALLYDTLKALGREEEYEKLAGRGEALLWVGAALGVLIGAPVAGAVSTQFTIFVGAGTMVAVVAVTIAMTEAPRLGGSGERPSYWAGARQAVRVAWQQPAVRTAIVYTAALGAGLGATGYLIQPFLLDKGLDIDFTFSALQLPGLVAAIVGASVAYRLVARSGPVAVLATLPVVGVGAYVALALVDHLGALPFLVLVMLARSTIEPIASGYVNRRVPSDQRATILSMQSLALGLLLAPFSAGVGVIFDELGLGWAFALAGIALGGLALVAGPLWVRAHRRERLRPGGVTVEPVAPSVVAPSLPPRPGDPSG